MSGAGARKKPAAGMIPFCAAKKTRHPAECRTCREKTLHKFCRLSACAHILAGGQSVFSVSVLFSRPRAFSAERAARTAAARTAFFPADVPQSCSGGRCDHGENQNCRPVQLNHSQHKRTDQFYSQRGEPRQNTLPHYNTCGPADAKLVPD